MKKLILKTDFAVARFIHKNLNKPWINKTLSRINRGETLLVLFLLSLYFFSPAAVPLFFLILYVAVFSFITDRFVLFLKKKISRERPLTSVIGKVDSNPDMRHSFPSAHSANSMTLLFLLVFGFQFPAVFLVISFLAGIGRMLSLHHFLSDVIGGWVIGAVCGAAGVFILHSGFLQLH